LQEVERVTGIDFGLLDRQDKPMSLANGQSIAKLENASGAP
jgi:hypothetical protein